MADYKIPAQPANLFPMPFADEGAKTIIPDSTTLHARATIPNGFPNETQLPLTQGGVAPNRLDFQGILYMLSAFAFWQQSGGMFSYTSVLNYAPPSLVIHNGGLWWCQQENGPATTAGEIEPGTNEAYWIDLLKKLTGSGSGGLVPVGTVISGMWTNAPNGYLPCDGSSFSASTYPNLYSLLGKSTTPDLRGVFIRGYDPGAVRDPNGNARGIGNIQNDAIRNITGSVKCYKWWENAVNPTGAFSVIEEPPLGTVGSQTNPTRETFHTLNFSAAGSVPTSTENRPVNANLFFAIKHD